MAGLVQDVFVKTDLGHLIKIKPHVRILPTLGKFCAMIWLSVSSPKAVRLRDFVDDVGNDCTPVFVLL